MTYSIVKTTIQSYLPILAYICTTNLQTSHAVVICVYVENDAGNYYYKLDDPNISSQYILTQVYPNFSHFTYTSGSNTYTLWNKRFF